MPVAETKFKHTFGVDIANGKTLNKQVSMYGYLEVNSFWKGEYGEGPGLDVAIDRSLFSSGSRIEWKRLLAGAHELQMAVSGERVSRNIEIRPDSPLKVNLRVEKKPQAEEKQEAADAALMP